MKRIRLPMRRTLFIVCATLVFIVMLLPLRVAFNVLDLGNSGLAARSVRGSVWMGRIEQLNVGALPVGTVRAGVSPFALLVGKARLGLSRHAGVPDDLDGAITLGSHIGGIDDMTASLPTAAAFFPVPISGIDLKAVSVRFGPSGCERAQGVVVARMAGVLPGINLSNGLSGPAQCEGRDFHAPLVSQSGMEHLDLRIAPGGTYTIDLLVQTGDVTLGQELAALGFQPVSGGHALKISGTF